MRQRSRLEAIAIMCFASACFIAMHTCIKATRDTTPVAVVLWTQYVIQLAVLTAIFAPRMPGFLRSPRLGLQYLRAALLFGCMVGMFTAVGLMPLADIIAIAFFAPLIITALSVAMLGEKVTPAHWAAVAVAFVGVLVIIRPGMGVFAWAALIPLGVAVCVALYQTLTKVLAGVDAEAMLYNATLLGFVASSVAVPFFWQTPGLRETVLLAAAGALGLAAHFCLIKAYQWAPASVVAPFSYVELLYATALGFAVFGDIPDAPTFAGGALVAASGLWLLHYQARRERAARAVAVEAAE
ncbi:MAG: DMT family transporter [Alphaproteobacteria bacterium]